MKPQGVLALNAGKRCLIVAASGLEAAAIARGVGITREFAPDWRAIALNDRLDLVVSGVGKANAAGATARVLDVDRHAMVLSLGIGGMLSSRVKIGDCVLGTLSVYADEGVPSPDGGFQDVAALGFPPNAGTSTAPAIGVESSDGLRDVLRGICDTEAVIATVSECSGTDARAAEIRRRSGAEIEAMEGAAVGFCVQRLGKGMCGFAEVRIVSNTTGDRPGQRWDIRTSTTKLEALSARL